MCGQRSWITSRQKLETSKYVFACIKRIKRHEYLAELKMNSDSSNLFVKNLAFSYENKILMKFFIISKFYADWCKKEQTVDVLRTHPSSLENVFVSVKR